MTPMGACQVLSKEPEKATVPKLPSVSRLLLQHIGFGSGPDPCVSVEKVRPLPWRAKDSYGYSLPQMISLEYRDLVVHGISSV